MGDSRQRIALAMAFLQAGMAASVCASESGVGLERVRFHALGIEQGLPQPTARSLVQDAAGFVWIGTQDGLVRYDGHDFEIFRHHIGAADGIGDNHITALAAHADGSVWIGTQSGGLARRDAVDGSIDRFQYGTERARGLLSNQIGSLLYDGQLGLWLGTSGGHLQHWDGHWTSPELGLPSNPGQIRSLRAGTDGSLLIAARHGAWRCPRAQPCGEVLRDERGRPHDAYDLLQNADHTLWVGSNERGLFHHAADGSLIERLHQRGAQQRRIADDAVRNLLRDRHGRLWVATNNGLTRFDADDGGQRTWRQRPGSPGALPASRVHSLMESRDGLVWVGTWTRGVGLFDPDTESFGSIASNPESHSGLPSDVVASVWADEDGSLWLGMPPNEGLAHFDVERGLLRHYRHDPDDPSSLSHNFVQHIMRDRRGRLWAATQGGGLNRLREDGSGFDRFQHEPGNASSLASNHLLYAYADNRNSLWVGTLDAGLSRLCDDCESFDNFGHDPDDPETLGGSTVNSVFEDSRGRIWVALRPGGLSRWLGGDRFERINARPDDPQGLSGNTITVIFEDRRGALWLGTQGAGLNRMVDDTPGAYRFERVSRADGLGADAIGGMFEDAAGRFWISTTVGISRLDPVSGAIENYGGREGAQPSGYFISSNARLPDGRIAFGGLRGMTLFDPMRIGDKRQPGPVAIVRTTSIGATDLATDPLALADVLRSSGRLHLRHPARDISLDFSALAFAASDSLRYRYRLDGFDTDWRAADPRRRIAAYTNLEPGHYQFRVQALRDEQPGPETLIALQVDPAPWQSPWAIALYALASLGLLALFIGMVMARRRERRSAQRSLRQSEERLKLALWGTGDELWDIDLRSGAISRENPLPFVPATPEGGATATTMRSLMHPDDVQPFDSAFAAHLMGRNESFEMAYRIRDLNDNWHWVRARGRVAERDASGRALRIAGTIGDADALQRSQVELQRLNQDLEGRVEARTSELSQANQQLQQTIADLKLAQTHLVESEKLAALGGLVAGVAHEINTPLGVGVTAASHLQVATKRFQALVGGNELKRSDLETYQGIALESSEIILRNLGRADKLVKSFKQVAVDQGSEAPREIELAEYLDEILTSLRPALKRSGHTIEVACPAGLVFLTQPGALYQVVVNLVMNSVIHAFEEGQIGEIRIEATRRGDVVVLSYADNGRGMDEDARRRIFEPFFTTRRGQGGSGLGMHIVFNLVTQVLRGSIEFDSAPGQGVYFSISIPLAPGTATSA
jgi:ligand-binding sensor domain-containing protein/signal transduction histidine kinase